MTRQLEVLGTKLASALLLHRGELALEDIEALPFLSDPSEAEVIVRTLISTFDVEIQQRMISSHPVPRWERVIKLRNIRSQDDSASLLPLAGRNTGEKGELRHY